MKQKMIRGWAVLLCVVLLLTMLTGCGGGSNNSSAPVEDSLVLPPEETTTTQAEVTTTTGTTGIPTTTAQAKPTTTATPAAPTVPATTTVPRPALPTLPQEPVFLGDAVTDKQPVITGNKTVNTAQATIEAAHASATALERGKAFSQAIQYGWITGFQKPGDQMVHVSTYTQMGGYYYMTYYANTSNGAENPDYQLARLAYCPVNATGEKTYIDLQKVGDKVGDKTVTGVYDTILMQKDDRTLYLLWTARLNDNYYRLYRLFDTDTKQFVSEVRVNRLQVNGERVDFSTSGMQTVFAKHDIPYRAMFSDIGIMQKISARVENGVTYYYSGAYSGYMTFIIKSRDLMTWEYVAQPDFDSATKWENAVYVIGDRVYYFVRQEDPGQYAGSPYGLLTYYDLSTGAWAPPVQVADCQSRSDFIVYKGELYLFYAPINRNHIGVLHINQQDIRQSKIVLQATMHESCFYPFVQYCDGKLYFSYTMNRKKIQFSRFDAERFLLPWA